MFIESFYLAGIKLNNKTSNKDGRSKADCSGLWDKFQTEKCLDSIHNRINDNIYAVYYDYEGDFMDPFSYFIGCKVASPEDTPDDMHTLIIPAGEYEKHEARGKLPECIARSWTTIWDSAIKRAYRPDFEVYGENSQDWNDALVDIYISVD
jgi:predicted transcriptional regulator YdeE